MNILLKSISQKNQNSLLLYNSGRINSPNSKNKLPRIILSSTKNKTFGNQNNLSNIKQKNCYNLNNKKNNKNIYHSNYFLNDSYLLNDKSKSTNKKINNKSFYLNSNKENKYNYLKYIKKENEKDQNSSKNKNINNPRLYKGPIDLKHLIITNKINEIIKDLMNCLNKNEIHFNGEKNNKYKFECKKDENVFEIEIYSIYNKDIENKNLKKFKLYYFTYISKVKNKIALKSYLDILSKSIIDKYRNKNL